MRGDAEVGCGGCLGMEDRQQSAAWIRSNLFHILHLTRTSPALNGTEKNKVIGKRSGNRKINCEMSLGKKKVTNLCHNGNRW